MTTSLTLIPAYGRDYKTRAAVLTALASSQDFRIADMSSRYYGSYCNVEDLRDEPDTYQLKVRYGALAKSTMFTLAEVRAAALKVTP